MATYSSVLAWRIPGTKEPGGLPSMGSHRVGHDWSDLAAAAAGETNWECRTDIHTLLCVKRGASGMLLGCTGSSAWCSAMTWRSGMRGWEEGSRGRGYMYTPDSLWCASETITILKSNYTPIKKKKIICLNNHASLSQPVICGQSVLTHHDGWSSSIKINPYLCIV